MRRLVSGLTAAAAFVVATGCSHKEKDGAAKESAEEKPKSGETALETSDGGLVLTPLRPRVPPPAVATSAERPPAVPVNAPGACKSDLDCLPKDGVAQRCCILGGDGRIPPFLGCQDVAKKPCVKPCATDADCPVKQQCKAMKSGDVTLRGCGP